MIPHNIIEDIKFRCPIEDVISSYVTLKKAGNNYKGLCPFHSEKTPSFTVFPQTQSYYCFGCGAGGDVITFTMKNDNLDYADAVEALAARCGISLPHDEKNINTGTGRSRILEMNLEAAKFFRSMLFDERIGAPAREYVQKRELSGAVVKHFGLGYAPDSFDALRNHLKNKGFSYEEMQDAFLCKRSEKSGNYFDLFRGRLMFPIIDNSGNIIAFGGRVLDDSKPKYLNTSDTAAFKKSKNLFALNFARHHCAEKLIVCEGYMDVIAMHAAGFENAVATLGTAITSEHARMLKKYTKKVILSYDSDKAGQNATEKAIRLLSEVGLETGILVMNGAKDPDEFIKKFGREKFRELIDGSRTRFDYRMESLLNEHDISNDAEKIKALSELCSYIAAIPSKVEREIYISRAAEKFSVSKESITQDVNSAIRKNARYTVKKRREDLSRERSGMSDRVNPDFVRHPKLGKLEETVLGLVLFMNEYISVPVDGQILTVDDFSNDYCRRLFGFVKDKYDTGDFSMSMLPEAFNESEVSKAYGLMTARMELDSNSQEVFAENVKAMRAEKLKNKSDVGDSIENIRNILDAKNQN